MTYCAKALGGALNRKDCMMIEKDIPIPLPRNKAAALPFRSMEIGNSILLSEKIKSTAKSGGIVNSWRKKTGRKFTPRSVMVDGLPRVRVWRIE